MKYTRTWEQDAVAWEEIARRCQTYTDAGWTVHTIMHVTSDRRWGAIIVAWKDGPDMTGGVPR